jgi:hypothetical protein
MRRFLAMSLFSLVSVPALPAPNGGYYMNGNQLHEYFQQANTYADGVGAGYVLGIADEENNMVRGATPSLCIPVEVTRRQLRDIVNIWLSQHPETRHYAARGLVVAALIEAFPCPEPQAPPAK